VHRLELGVEGAEARLEGVDAALPVAALAHPEGALDPVVMGCKVVGAEAQSPGRLPLGEVSLVGAQRDLGVDRRGAADAAPGDDPDRAAGAAVDHRLAKRPPDAVGRLGLPAGEVRGRAVRAGLQQHDPAAALGELARDHPTPGAGADDGDVEALAHAPIPR
jgi:hypothetical protein